MDLSVQLQELISKNLPEQTAGAMKTYLAKMDATEKANAYLEAQVKTLKVELDASKSIQQQQGLLLQKHDTITAREDAVTKREVRQEVQDIRVSEAAKRSDEMKELVSIIFRNQTLVKTRSTHGSMPVERTYGNNSGSIIEQAPTNSHTTETVVLD